MPSRSHKKHSPIHTKSLASTHPTTPATHPGTAVPLASVQSSPLEQLGLATSADRDVISDFDVAGCLPFARAFKKLFSRSGSLEPRQGSVTPSLAQPLPELGRPGLALSNGGEDNLLPNVVERPPDRVPTGQSHQDGAEELNAGGGAATPSDKAQRTVTTVACAALKDILRMVVRMSDVFPPLKSATAGFLVVIERVEAVDGNKKEFAKLQKKLDCLSKLLETSKDGITPSLSDWMDGLARSFENKSKSIEDKKNAHYMKGLLDSTFDASFIIEELQSLTFEIDIILLQTNLKTNTTVTEMSHNAILDRLGHVSGSEFHREDREGCLEGTRLMLLADIFKWATDSSSPHVFWLNGMAGTAHTYSSFEKALIKTLNQEIDTVGMNLHDQYHTLVLKPAQEAFKGSPKSIILSVDALDECEETKEETIEKFLMAIIDNKPSVPLKFFLAGRPEIALRDSIASVSGNRILKLHDIEDHIVEADIRLYLDKKLYSIKRLREAYTSWPPSELTAIVKRAGKLFIYAFTAYNYISYKQASPCYRLEELAKSTQPLAVNDVDDLYTTILDNAFKGATTSYQSNDEQDLKISAPLDYLMEIDHYQTPSSK
ncbi:hypothetical protein BDQ12DRAFT_714649 [Crucibulum laeve]|uniref:Nephrocystin 3-like N-terminal domain-containing protein n=1 Tax=Crucibulum laeve TaxID=68775 RepID=A0A5C3LRT2_9AGAR|nr:hypothetical protein BDQ12DRAFT_714649 [Crucibulum laeve]